MTVVKINSKEQALKSIQLSHQEHNPASLNMNIKKNLNFGILSLLLFSGFSFSKELEYEISDLNQAKTCFSIEAENTQISQKIEALKREISKKELENADFKLKNDKEFHKISSINDENEELKLKKIQILKKYQSSIQKYKLMEKALVDLKFSLNQQEDALNSNKAKHLKMKCQIKFSEEAIEKICLIDKLFPASCNKVLATYMNHLKD